MLLSTFDGLSLLFPVFSCIDKITGVLFIIEYLLRLYTADIKYNRPFVQSVLRFAFSFTGIVDLCTILPIFLSNTLPGGIVAFRLIRVVRTFRLFQVTVNSDAINLIVTVVKQRSRQLLAAGFFFGVLDIFASLMMYYIEHTAQPDVFVNAFSGIWWSISTLLTVGYGDIYPVTTLGKVVAIFVAILGVCAVAVPTGIISAGFVEQYHVNQVNVTVDESLIKRTRTAIKDKPEFATTLDNMLKLIEK
ncbi:MAG: ion transporter [Lachnospiraceae bacterium]|nr:ion transporter [Lachnospiraceae bacterium]